MLLFFRLHGRTNAQLRPEAMDFGAGVFRVTALCGADGDPLRWCDRSVRFPQAPFV
jgi:hypothetical protein